MSILFARWQRRTAMIPQAIVDVCNRRLAVYRTQGLRLLGVATFDCPELVAYRAVEMRHLWSCSTNNYCELHGTGNKLNFNKSRGAWRLHTSPNAPDPIEILQMIL